MRIVESPWEMARGDLTSVSALIDPAGELSWTRLPEPEDSPIYQGAVTV
jgi:hypothetical protein